MAAHRSQLSLAALILCAASLAILSACGESQDGAAAAPSLPVGVATVERQDIPLYVELVGTTLGIQDVPIRARVEGFLETLDFKEGRFVSKGDVLYTIDPQPFQAKVVEAQSGLAAAQTNHVKAEADLGRIKPLAAMDAVSQQDLDSAVAMEAAARANVRASEAGLELANIEMSYTRITAPISGLIGISLARPGEFVGREPNPVVLNVLSDIDPIRVRFSISEREYIVLSRTFLEQRGDSAKELRAEKSLDLILADGSEHAQTGKVIATAQAVNTETGTYTLEAVFPNPDNLVLPGQFARVRALYSNLDNVVVVPRRAIIEIQGLFRVYVVESDNTVSIRNVTTGPVSGNLQVIQDGLEGGESIIVDGIQRVRPDMKVAPHPFVENDGLPKIDEL